MQLSAIPLAKLGTHIPALDGIRGMAIILVMLYHFIIYGGLKPLALVDRFFRAAASGGWCGVDLFFVLSGFLITGILLDAKGRPYYFRDFYMRRVLRIFPLYYGILVVFFIVLPHLLRVDSAFHLLLQEQGWYWSYLVNWHYAYQGWPSYGAIGHFWSLAIEEQFYFFWPVLVFWVRRPTLFRICVGIIIVSLGIRVEMVLNEVQSVVIYVLTPTRLDTLAIGALLALVVREPNCLARWSRRAGGVAGASALILFIIALWKQGLYVGDGVTSTIGYTLLAVLFGAILLISVTSGSENVFVKLFTHPVLMFFGRYSYGLYVFHHPVIFFMRRKGLTVGLFPTFLDSQLPGQILIIVIATGLSLCLALFSWHLYEVQFLKLKAFFPYQLTTSTAKSLT